MSEGAETSLTSFIDHHPSPEDFRGAVVHGLSLPQKALPSKFFYDEAGSALFDEICQLEEYYPTRTEIGILRAHVDEIAALAGPRRQLVEFGSGSSVKSRILLEALEDLAAYLPIDISREHLLRSATDLAAAFPNLKVIAVCADYTRAFDLPVPRHGSEVRQLGFFPGSSIGNLTPERATEFLANAANRLAGGSLLVGVDLKKDSRILDAAYNDSRGVTAAFNLNLLARINRELAGGFDLNAFAHQAFYSDALGRVEMHLSSMRPQSVRIDGDAFDFGENETIHTENSYKYTIDEFQSLARRAGLSPKRVWSDPDWLFSIHYLEAASSAARAFAGGR